MTASFGLPRNAEVYHASAPNWNRRVGDRLRTPGPRRAGRPDGVYLPHVDQCIYLLQTPSGPGGFNEGDRFYADYLHAGCPRATTCL